MFCRAIAAILAALFVSGCQSELALDLPDTPPEQWRSSIRVVNDHVLRLADGQIWVDDVCYGHVSPGARVRVETSGPDEGVVTVNGQVVHPVESNDG